MTVVLSCLFQTALAAATLTISLDKNSVEQGLPVRATVNAAGHKQNLNDIDLSPLQENFGISIDEFSAEPDGSSDGDDQGNLHTTQSLQLRLYPRKTGTMTVPALMFHGSVTAVMSIDVTPAIIKGKALVLETQYSATRVWQRQQLIIHVTIETPDKFSSLGLDDKPIPGMTSHTLQPGREWITSNGSNRTLLHAGWILYPDLYGEHIPALPEIRYTTGGTVERHFYLPLASINVRALPPYIPPTIPVGTTGLAIQANNTLFLQPGETAYWQITLTGTALLPSRLPLVLKQIKSGDKLAFLPAETTSNSSPNASGMHGLVTHRVPFKPAASGFSSLPSLRIQYFDPVTARLETVTTPAVILFTLGTGWRLLLASAAVIVFVSGLWFVGKLLLQGVRRRRRLNHALLSIQQADDWHAIRQGLKLYARAQGWPDNLPLSSWREHWQSRYATDQTLNQLVDEISDACYRKVCTRPVESARAQLLLRLYHPTPLI